MKGGAKPRDRGAEIFRPLTVEALLMRAEACDAGPDLVLLVAMQVRERRRTERCRRFEGPDRLVWRCLKAGRSGLGFGPDGRRIRRHGRKSGFRFLGVGFWRLGYLGGD
jgi:hypothetical protein